MSHSSEYDPRKMRNVALTPQQIEYIKRLIQADLHSREKDYRHAVAYGVDYDDPGMDVAAYALAALDDPRENETDREPILNLIEVVEQVLTQSDRENTGVGYCVRGDLFKALDAAYDAIDHV